jgi:hypothetical protein
MVGVGSQVEAGPLIYHPTVLSGIQNDKFLIFLELMSKRKGHQGSNPGGHSSVFLNVSINKKPVFLYYVVKNKKGHLFTNDHNINKK